MNAIILMVTTFLGYIVAYHTYGRFLAQKIFKIGKHELPASKEYEILNLAEGFV